MVLLSTWRRFHDVIFDKEVDTPYLPISPRCLIVIGAMFKSIGYRSYPNTCRC